MLLLVNVLQRTMKSFCFINFTWNAIWLSKVNFESSITPRYFWNVVWVTALLLKIRWEWLTWFVFLLKITYWACLLEPVFKLIFHWKTQFLITDKSSFNSLLEVLLSWITENQDVQSVNNLSLEKRPFEKSDKNNGPSIELWPKKKLTSLTLPFVFYRLKSPLQYHVISLLRYHFQSRPPNGEICQSFDFLKWKFATGQANFAKG